MAVPITYTNFVPPAVDAGNLNTVNTVVYTVIGDGTNAPATAANVRTNIGLGTVATLNTIPVANGGTGATTAAAAAVNLNVSPIGATFRATRITSTQSLVSSVTTVVLFNNSEWDTAGYYSTGTGRFTPLVAGYYQISWGVNLAPSAATFLTAGFASLFKNGAEYARGGQTNVNAGSQMSAVGGVGATLVFFNGTTDFIDVRALGINSAAGTVDLLPNVGLQYFSAVFIRP